MSEGDTNSFQHALLSDWRLKAANPVAWGIIVVVMIVVVGVHFLALSLRPSHMNEIADELGSVSKFTGKPFSTENGAFLSFSRGTENGSGLYVRSRSDSRERLVYEDSGNRTPTVFGWSPDERMLAFTGTRKGKNAVMIYDNKSEQLDIPTIQNGSVTEFGWLSPSSFVFLKGGSMHVMSRKQNSGFMRMDKHENGTWSVPYYFATEDAKNRGCVPIRGLMIISSDSLAWMAGNSLWELKFHESEPVLVWDGADTNEILSCSYSMESEAFLMRLRNHNRQYLATYSPGTRRFMDLGDLAHINAVNFSWINQGTGYAYLVSDTDFHWIFVKINLASNDPAQGIREGGVREFTAAGDSIYSIGTLEDQPEGVVEYNILSGSSDYVVPNSCRLRFAKNERPVVGLITNSSGEIHPYRLWRPVTFDSRKKYPLVLAQQRNLWNEGAQAVANAGAFYISVDRPDFSGQQIQHWTEDVMAALGLMYKDPNVDTNKLFLTGSSTETEYLSDLLNEKPTLWKGAVLSNPTVLPDPLRIGSVKCLIIYGESSNDKNLGKIKAFQQAAARVGRPVTVAAVSSGRNLVSVSANKTGIQEFLRFIFE